MQVYVCYHVVCDNSDRSDLQKIQTDILRLCYKIKLSDQIGVKELHTKSTMISL